MIERAHDFRRVRRLSNWDMVLSPDIFYLVEIEDGVDLGVWALCPYEGQLIIHGSMTEQCRGKRAAQSARNAFKWIFENTHFDTIYANVPGDYRHVHLLASHVGMKYYRTNDDGFRCFYIEKSAILSDQREVA